MKHEIRAMLRSGGGAIVNTSSVGGHVGFPGASVYVASKFAVIGLTKTAALEFAKDGIRVNSVSPGPIQTEMFDRAFGEGQTDMEKSYRSAKSDWPRRDAGRDRRRGPLALFSGRGLHYGAGHYHRRRLYRPVDDQAGVVSTDRVVRLARPLQT